MRGKKRFEKELDQLKWRITEELKLLKQSKFPGLTDNDFDEEFGLSRGILPGIESNQSWPDVPTIYTWARHCGSSLTEIFRAQSNEYSEDTRELHHKLEYVLKASGDTKNSPVADVINTYYERLSPPPRAPRKRKPPSGPQSKKAGAVTVGS